ncbi:MAG: InlB B-repeat-containing protein, partial [Candidatus Bathyarchaeota archaeon]|nr:InlB B-repeat-containing protein [Candidatus Termiticorpusculum sp.]
LTTCANDTQLVLPQTGIPAGTTGNLTLTAIWNPNPITYTITYNLNSGTSTSYNPTEYTIASGTINIPAPVRTGYAFQGWTITYDYNSAFASSEALVGSVIPAATTGNILLSANWEEI